MNKKQRALIKNYCVLLQVADDKKTAKRILKLIKSVIAQVKYLILLLFLAGCYEVETYNIKYAIDTDKPINADVTYKVGNDYKTVQINGSTWESETVEIDDKQYYYYIKLNSHETKGTFYIIKDSEVYETSAIFDDTRIENEFSGYINADCKVKIGL